MDSILVKGRIDTLIKELSYEPELKPSSNIISLSTNELASLLLKISSDVRKELPIDRLLEGIVNLLGNSGLAERVLLFQIDNENTKALLTHYWESPYLPKFNPVGFQLDLRDAPLFKLFHLNLNRTLQIENFLKYLSLPNYLFRNKFKAIFIKLKTRSLLLAAGSSKRIRVALSLQFCNKDVIWSNEIEKVLQSIVDQLTIAIEQYIDKRKKEKLQKNLLLLQEKAVREQEELLRQFAGDVHDLPCSIIPKLRKAIHEKDFNECERLVDELHNNLRQLINEYVVPDVSLLGFGSAVYQYINGFKKSFKGSVIVEMPEEEINLSTKKGIELFKVMKEWFCNIEKHSGATNVTFRLEKINENYILLSITDSGKGFNTSDTKNLGYGILNIVRRLNDIKAKHEIKSEIGSGSTLKIQLCLDD